MKQCCICGIMLPNKYAIGGACEHPDCNDVFCRYHWDKGHRKCLRHGGREELVAPEQGEQQKELQQENIPMEESNDTPEQEKTKKNNFMSKFASGVMNIKKTIIKDKAEELRKLEETLARYEKQRASLYVDLEKVDRTIIEKKKLYNEAPPFRKSILKSELERLLGQHKNLERRITTILNNENNLSAYIYRSQEMKDIIDTPIKEKDIDILTGKLEDAVDVSEGIKDASKDLNSVKGVSSKSMDLDDFNAELDMFGDGQQEDFTLLDGFSSVFDSSDAEQKESASELEQPIKD